MRDKRAVSIARQLTQKYKTRDPEKIAEAKGFVVWRRYDLKHQKGFFKVIANVCYIFVNGNLSEQMQRMVIAHELGHAILHKQLCVELGGIIEFELFDMTSQTEYDANVFQATLLIDEEELIDYLKEGNDLVFIAKSLGINVNLLLLKLNLMNQENSEYNFNLPYIPHRDFLGTIDDNAGEL